MKEVRCLDRSFLLRTVGKRRHDRRQTRSVVVRTLVRRDDLVGHRGSEMPWPLFADSDLRKGDARLTTADLLTVAERLLERLSKRS